MKITLQGDNAQRCLQKMRKDPMIRNLLTRSPEEIINWWNNKATAQQKDNMMLRITLLVAGLVRGQIE
jgi:hypothetical protein